MGDLLNPPFPTDSGGLPSQDFQATTDDFTKLTLQQQLKFLIDNAAQLVGLRDLFLSGAPFQWKQAAGFTEIIADILLGLFKIGEVFTINWLKLEETLFSFLREPVQALDVTVLSFYVQLLEQAFQGQPGTTVQFGNTQLAGIVQSLYNTMIKPFTLLGNTADITQPGSGFQNQEYLLSTALNLALQEKVVEDMGNHFGMGALKTLAPLTAIVDQSINPRNIVRQAMDSSYAFLLKAPVTRDLNRKYPIKDLGLTALAHLKLRGVIDDATYLDRCLDAGLNNEHAQQLLLEAGRKISEADIAKLYTKGIITLDDARNLLMQSGYDPRLADAIIHLRTHDRAATIEERVGTAAVSKWVAGKIDQATMEGILQQTGFTSFEITLLELEQAWAKVHPDFKPLTYSDTKRLFEANIIGIDEVVTFLDGQGYSPTDVQNLVLLDFTVAAERQARKALLIARYRVQAQTDLAQAAAATAKNQTALADAKKALASELNSAAAELGQLEALPGILALTGSIP